MSTKKLKKYGDIKVPAQSLMPPDKDGYLTKQGGSIKTWNRRYFILKGSHIYYYKTPRDQVFTGRIDLEPGSTVKEEPGRKKPNLFAIQTQKRTFYMYPDKPEEMKEWMDAILKSISTAKPLPPSAQTTEPVAEKKPEEPRKNTTPAQKPAPGANIPPRERLSLAKQEVKFLKNEESKVLEFWQIWSESIPPREELASDGNIEFHVAASADMQKLTWRTNGPQNIFIQKMVDFFWNVGAPESEIDRLNDVGALINPIRIGSWIDMSGKGGMDGGWYFPVDIPIKLTLEASDAGEAVNKFGEWCDKHGISAAFAVGRDMGAAPPRQTEVRFKLPGNDFEDQVKIGLDAYATFGFPPIPDDALKVMREGKGKVSKDTPLCMSVITSSEGFVRIGLLQPKPSTQSVVSLCTLAGGNSQDLASFEASVSNSGSEGPMFVEYQYLMKGFGYGVYKEGFDIVFHYHVGSETLDQ